VLLQGGVIDSLANRVKRSIGSNQFYWSWHYAKVSFVKFRSVIPNKELMK
jgi:hypothetical protein